MVEEAVFLELKVAEAIASAHYAQLVHYLRATRIEVGLLLNLGPQPAFKRLFVSNESKSIRLNPCKSAVGGC
jgi:GxxExxY protein